MLLYLDSFTRLILVVTSASAVEKSFREKYSLLLSHSYGTCYVFSKVEDDGTLLGASDSILK